jgi:hypothetical protein
MTKLGFQRLQTTLEALSRLEHGGGARARAAVAIGLDDWLPYTDPIPGAYAPEQPTEGFALPPADPAPAAWLVPGGRLMSALGPEPGAGFTTAPLSDVEVDPMRLVGPLRHALLTSYVGGVPLSEMSGPPVPVVVNDLFSQLWGLDPDGRLLVITELADAMRLVDGWDQAAARLKGGFERGVGDRSPAVRAASARALVRMAVGSAPAPPVGEPVRILNVLFTVPMADVHVATLQALAEQSSGVLADLGPTLGPRLNALAADPDPETRRLAGELELRLAARPEADALAGAMTAASTAERVRALHELRDAPSDLAAVLLPKVLDAVADPDPEVRAAAAEVLVPLLEHEPDGVRARIVVALLTTPDPQLARTGLAYLAVHPVPDALVTKSVRDALDGPEENRATAAALVCRSLALAGTDDTIEGYGMLLRHRDPVVRQTALRDLVSNPPGRPAVLDELLYALIEHLRDPEPMLRVEAARALVALNYPKAAEIVSQLALDPEPVARRGVLALLRDAGDPVVLRHAEVAAAQVDLLCQLPTPGDGDARVRWLGALDAVVQEKSPRVVDTLATVLAGIPADTNDPFLRQAMVELDQRLLERTGGGTELLVLCRRFLEPPMPQPEHASRLAGAMAAESPAAMDFLWTMYCEAPGAASEAARRALGELTGKRKSAAVVSELSQLMGYTDDPARRDVLRTLIDGDGSAAGR